MNLQSRRCVFGIEVPMAEAEAELMRRIQRADGGALDELMIRHGGVLRRHLERYVPFTDAEDLLQELWLRVWQRAGQWDGRGRLLAWLLAVATNLALNHLRGRRPVVPLSSVGAEEFSQALDAASDAILPGPEDQAVWRGEVERLRSAIELLPADQRAALRLVRLEGQSLRDAAAALGVPIGTIKSRLHHAHRLLMEYLEDEP